MLCSYQNKSFLKLLFFTLLIVGVIRLMDLFGFKQEINNLRRDVRMAFRKVQAEAEEHLDSINESTSEIQSIQETCSEFDCKIDKLSERIDEIYLILEKAGLIQKTRYDFIKQLVLTKNEDEIFSLLIGSEDDLSFLDISHKTGLDQDSIKIILSSLVQKGVPIVQKFLNNSVYLNVQKEFKEAKEKDEIPIIVL